MEGGAGPRTVAQGQEYPPQDTGSKASSSIYEKIYPMRLPMMAIGGIVFLVGLGMFIGGFAGLVADMDVKIRRTGSPNVGYMLMLIVSVVVMVGGGVAVFCGCGAIRYNKKMTDIREGRRDKYKVKKPANTNTTKPGTDSRSAPAFTSAHSRRLEANGDVTYTVTYQYSGPPPGEINGIPAYPAPPPDLSPTLKIDQPLPPCHPQKLTQRPVPLKQPKQAYMDSNREQALALANVPRKLVLVKRV